METDPAVISDEFDRHKEPEEVFTPLDSARYSQFYALEMADFDADFPFYRDHIATAGAQQKTPLSVLELGCGTGRLCRLLATTNAEITGIDLSFDMLRLARKATGQASISYLCMDMTALAFAGQFDTVIIPYHTLNLLLTAERIIICLRQIKSLLTTRGQLLLQLYVPDEEALTSGDKKIFQFKIMKRADGGRVIKETRRSCIHEQLILEERYRVRPQRAGSSREDYNHTFRLAAFAPEKWLSLFHDAGFTFHQQRGGYQLSPFLAGRDSCLFIKAGHAENTPTNHLEARTQPPS